MTSHLKTIFATCLSVLFIFPLFSQTSNTATGTSALFSNTTGSYNTATGASALYSNTTGSYNTAGGDNSLFMNTTGNNNISIGGKSMYCNLSGRLNVANGFGALYSNTTGSDNSAIGTTALFNNTTGSQNIAIGSNAGRYISGGIANSSSSYSVFVGTNTKPQADAQTNQVVIGCGAVGNGSNTVTLGDNSITSTILKGKIGIGTTTPGAKLDVASFIDNNQLGTVLGRLAEGNPNGDGTYLGVKGYSTQTSSYNGKSFSLEHHFYGQTNSSINFFRGGGMTGGYITFNTNDNSEKMRINSNGNVSIGTIETDPSDALLTVKGKIHVQEVLVDLNAPLADYVFDENYKLMPLHQVEQFVKTNNHLPEIPSAAEVQKNGLSMGEMQNKLLQKIEELTLYVIEQQKEIEKLKNQVEK